MTFNCATKQYDLPDIASSDTAALETLRRGLCQQADGLKQQLQGVQQQIRAIDRIRSKSVDVDNSSVRG